MPIRAHFTLPRGATWRRLLTVALAGLLLAGAPTSALAQSIVPDAPVTKEEARKAANSSTDSGASGSDRSITYGLLGIGALVLGAAAWWIVRDARDAVGDPQRAAPTRPLDTDAVGRGAPRTMFTGEAEPGGKTQKRKRREQGRRQRQARKANRTR